MAHAQLWRFDFRSIGTIKHSCSGDLKRGIRIPEGFRRTFRDFFFLVLCILQDSWYNVHIFLKSTFFERAARGKGGIMDRYGLICRTILEKPGVTQREMAKELSLSLGTINNLTKECVSRGLIEEGDSVQERWRLLDEGRELLKQYKVDGAVIMAAGFGSRFVPLTFENPKGLLEVFGERMIERQIRQLHEVGIYDITIMVGYLKEKFEYLIDKYQVKLHYNPEYSTKNTLATIYHAQKELSGKNMYVLSSDNWLRENMFHAYECGAWYSSVYQKGETKEWCLETNKRGRITRVKIGGKDSWVMYGPAYFSREFSRMFLPVLDAYYQRPGTEQFYWEQVYKEMISGDAMGRLEEDETCGLLKYTQEKAGCPAEEWCRIEMDINRQPEDQVYEFENLEELRAFDPKYRNHSDNEAMALVARVFQVPESRIRGIRCLKSGMTNQSFLFQVDEKQYICRIPGPGTELLVNRAQEEKTYEAVSALGITENLIYLNPRNGYKIAEYFPESRNISSENWGDMERFMAMVRKLHTSGVSVPHPFDIRERIDFYERLCKANGGTLFEDYVQVRDQMNWLMDQLDKMKRPRCLCHVDANVDNCVVLKNGQLRLLDWEYAGMCDPLIDVAMCAIYSYYDDEQLDHLLEIYLGRHPDQEEQFVTYAYAALGGFLWSQWAVYKKALGQEFGEYTIIMYRYAKHYYQKMKLSPSNAPNSDR